VLLALPIVLLLYFVRVPEIVFKGSEVWIQMDDEEVLDVKDVLTWFLISSIMERLFHAVLEVRHLCALLYDTLNLLLTSP
jgi:hypothetical protein